MTEFLDYVLNLQFTANLRRGICINLQPAPSTNVESGLSHHGTQDSAANYHTVYEWSANRRPDGGPDMNAVQTAPEMVNEDYYRFFIEQTSS